jgi:hypothetical protein
MTPPEIVSLLFTQNLHGDLRFLPRLSRVLMHLRIEDRRSYTVDLGNSCAPDVWHCEATDGRSMLIALDGINYSAANAEGLTEQARPQLSRSLVTLKAVNAAHPDWIERVALVTAPPDEPIPGAEMTLVVKPSLEARVTGNVIEFPAVERYRIGRLRVRIDTVPFELVSVETFDVPPTTPPDPVVSGMIDFIEGEARHYQKRKSQS